MFAVEQSDGAAGSKNVIVWMWRKNQDGFILQVLQTQFLCHHMTGHERQEEAPDQNMSHA